MKKWLIGIVVTVVLLFLAGSYYYIPKKLFVSADVTVASNQQGLFRFLSSRANWEKWWPANQSPIKTDSLFRFNDYAFKLQDIRYNAFQIIIQQKHHTDTSVIHLIPSGNDSTKLIWDMMLHTGNNPFIKINGYRQAKDLKHTLARILDTLQLFAGSTRGIYGIDVKKEKVKIEYVVSAKKTFSQYPTTESVYQLISNIREYIGKTPAKEEDYPMLNISSSDSSAYLAQAGIPIDREIPQHENFYLKRLLKNGNILVAEVKGGRATCDSAMKAMELYATDLNHFTIALPFLSLITDRTKERDSSKWVTKVYYPVN